MIGSGLKKLATANGMKVSNGVAYGSLLGYAATMFEGSGFKAIIFVTKFTDLDKKNEFMLAVNGVNVEKEYRVRNINLSANRIEVVFNDNPGTMGKIEDFLTWFIPLLRNAQATPYNICPECGCEITSGRWVLMDGIACHMHDSCAQKAKREVEAKNEQKKEADDGSYITGAFGALLGAVIGAVLWAVVLKMGYVAGIVGFVIGWLANKGYDLLRGKQSKVKLVILGVAVIVGVLLGTFGGYLLELMELNPGSISDNIMWLIQLVDGGLIAEDLILNVLMGILFAALGVWALFAKAGREVAGSKFIELE